MTPPRCSTSLAIDAAALPRWANTISCSSACSPEDSSSADAGGALLRLGSTWYCSRQRYQEVATSGRTPRTRSSPARNRSRAAVTAWYRSASLMRWRFAVWLMVWDRNLRKHRRLRESRLTFDGHPCPQATFVQFLAESGP